MSAPPLARGWTRRVPSSIAEASGAPPLARGSPLGEAGTAACAGSLGIACDKSTPALGFRRRRGRKPNGSTDAQRRQMAHPCGTLSTLASEKTPHRTSEPAEAKSEVAKATPGLADRVGLSRQRPASPDRSRSAAASCRALTPRRSPRVAPFRQPTSSVARHRIRVTAVPRARRSGAALVASWTGSASVIVFGPKARLGASREDLGRSVRLPRGPTKKFAGISGAGRDDARKARPMANAPGGAFLRHFASLSGPKRRRNRRLPSAFWPKIAG